MTRERAVLLAHLDAERSHVLAAVEGLREPDLTRAAGPSGRAHSRQQGHTRSELEDLYSHQVSRGHTLWVVQISRSLQRRPGPCAYRSAWIHGNEIDAQPSNNDTSVVFV